MDKQQIVLELRRVAEKLQTTRLSQKQFTSNSKVSLTTVKYKFGSWNNAVESAGLAANLQGPMPELLVQKISDDELLQDIIRLTQELGKEPSDDAVNAFGKFTNTTYRKRWRTLQNARREAYAKFGYPIQESAQEENLNDIEMPLIEIKAMSQVIVAQTHKPTDAIRRKKVQFGEPINFRGLRFAPINEQGVVYLFGMISHELGFLVESVRTEYPDCEGKRCIDAKRQRWEHILIEFEYRSRNFREHGHAPDGCDLIVCWIHDWEDCPIEVLELRSQIKYLPNHSSPAQNFS